MREIRYVGRFKRDYKREKSGRHGKTLDAALMDVVRLLADDEILPRRNFRFPDPDGNFNYNSVTTFGIFMLKSLSKLVIFGQSLSAGAGYAQAAVTSRFS